VIVNQTLAQKERQYDRAMQRDPSAVLAHGQMMQVFAELAKA
jgi:hypothetical protein